MLTRLLHSCGLYLGSKDELMAAQADNPDGFWEHLGFVALNDELLSQLGGAWDLPPKPDEDFAHSRLDPLRMKARLLIERLTCSADCAGDTPATTESTHLWGWKDPRNSLTLPFWENLLPGMKTVIMVRNPLEVAHSMKERNGTSYSFGLRLWEIYNQRLIESASKQNRLVAHYDLFFEDPETELRRITNFIGLSDTGVSNAATLIKKRRRHTHFSLDDLIDARVAPRVIELYQALIAEIDQGVSPTATEKREHRASSSLSGSAPESKQLELLPGAVSRLDLSVPERIARVQHLERELLQFSLQHEKDRAEHFERELHRLSVHVAEQDDEIEKARQLVLAKNVSLAESESLADELRIRLREQLKATQKLSRFLDEAEAAATRLRSSARWLIANPIAALKAKLHPQKARKLLGYGHLEKILSAYQLWRGDHAEMIAGDDETHALISGKRLNRAQRLSPIEPPAPTRPIEFSRHQDVDVSIVIPVFNQFRFTQACLASLQENQGTVRFEVIIVDDCSTDETAQTIPQLPGVVYLRNETNSGFIVSCNRGADAARGKYLVFLNNDTLVRADWLTALVDTFAEEPRAGIVGSKLLYPDGRLQEAGGIIWRDASGWNYGKSDDPQKPEYNYLREVDYCSAAAFAIPKTLFHAVGGFDSRFAPAYYEDTDLAFKVREAGHKVLYQPLSEVIHYEGATGGTDLNSGTKKYQEINRSTFAEKWAAELKTKPINGDVAFLRNPGHGRKNILVIDHHVPMPNKDSGSLRMFQILRLLRQLGHRVTFVPDNVTNEHPYVAQLQKCGIQVIYHPYIRQVRDYLVTYGCDFDAVVLSRCDFARKHIADVRLHAPQSRVIFDTVDLHHLREDSEARLTRDPEVRRRAQQKERLEHELIEQADETWVVSPVEQRLLQKAWPDKSIQLLSNIVDISGSRTPFANRRDFLFIGGFQHRPNIDAVLFFVQKIYPLLSEQLRDAKFYIIGDKAPPEIVALATEKIVIAGLQTDVASFFDSVRLSVAPLRFGAGVKGKINQSMAFGVPVVATSIAVEGMGLTDREDILVADEPLNFARSVIELYWSNELWTQLSENGIRKTRDLYSTETAQKKLEVLFSPEHFEAASQSAEVARVDVALAKRNKLSSEA